MTENILQEEDKPQINFDSIEKEILTLFLVFLIEEFQK